MQLTSSREESTPSRVLCRVPQRIATLILTTFAVCLAPNADKCEGNPEDGRAPNIVVIMADDK